MKIEVLLELLICLTESLVEEGIPNEKFGKNRKSVMTDYVKFEYCKIMLENFT